MSDNEFDERVDEVEELVAKLRANDRTVKSLCLDFETWEDVWDGNRNDDVKAKIDGDVVKLCRALEDNDVVRRLGIGSCGGFEGGEAIYEPSDGLEQVGRRGHHLLLLLLWSERDENSP